MRKHPRNGERQTEIAAKESENDSIFKWVRKEH